LPNSSKSIDLEGIDPLLVFGADDELLRAIEQQFPEIEVLVRGNRVKVTGDSHQVELVISLVEEISLLASSGTAIGVNEVVNSKKILNDRQKPSVVLGQTILNSRGKSVRPKTLGQREYVDAIDNHTVVFGIGPAGTGKTYLAMAKAVQALQRKEVSRIILTRPAVEAGEKLGFLPGNLTEKIDPYLRPLFDALADMLEPEAVPKLLAAGTVEVAPLAYMRGRTLNDSFIILDEAQNTTKEQMKMFLTRLGFGSKMIITGDITQVDLPRGDSGLKTAADALDELDDLHFAFLTSEDVVRHSLVAKIVDAFANFESQANRSEPTIDRKSQVRQKNVRPAPGARK
jgi:phosphate starvation-inducible protein PhoH and related proteins